MSIIPTYTPPFFQSEVTPLKSIYNELESSCKAKIPQALHW